jgi:ubiquinone/menaquinone biosynthesis C-methylase UbiE
MTAETIKACCADLYASDWVRLLIGESFHPGGLALTERLAVLLELDANSRVLDLAAGRGTSALHLAREFGCRVVGLDYSSVSVSQATDAAERDGLSEQVEFLQGNAEQMSDLDSEWFDAVICECAYCTFPRKQAAAAEIARVLRPGGRFGLSDLTRNGPLPPKLDGLISWIACIADARPVDGYVADLEGVGLRVAHIEPHNEALAQLVGQVRGRLLAAEIMSRIQQTELPGGVDLKQAKQVARSAAEAVTAGTLGYTLIIARRDSHAE